MTKETYHVSNKEYKLFQRMNQLYLQQTEYILVSLYHRVLHDNITLNDIEDIGERYGLNISESYGKMMDTLIDEEDIEE